MNAVLKAGESDVPFLNALKPAFVRQFNLLTTAPDGVARLRELILALAVRGKLVPQRPEDEPAEMLLERIRTEGARLIAEGVIKREQSVDKISGDHPNYRLPRGWAWARIGELGQIVGGGTPKSDVDEYWAANGIAWLTPADLYGYQKKLICRGRRDISVKGLQESSARVLPTGSVLFSSRAPIGYVAIAGAPLATNQGFKSCVPHVPGLSEYLYWHLRQLAPSIDASASGTTFKEVSGKQFGNIVVALPPLAEQARIVRRVDELMRLCDALEANGRLEAEQHARLLDALLGSLTGSTSPEELATNWQRVAAHFDLLLDRPAAVDALEETILDLAVRGLLSPQVRSDGSAHELLQQIAGGSGTSSASDAGRAPFAVPAGWVWAPLGSLAKFIDYRGKTPTKTETGVPLITAKNVRSGFISEAPREFIAASAYKTWMTRGFPKSGDLLITTEAPLGNVAPITSSEPFALAQRVICLSLHEPHMSGALLCFLRSPWFQKVLASQATGVTAQGIKSARLQLLPVPVPPLAEQSRIASRVEQLHRLCAELREKLAAARELQARLAEALIDQAIQTSP